MHKDSTAADVLQAFIHSLLMAVLIDEGRSAHSESQLWMDKNYEIVVLKVLKSLFVVCCQYRDCMLLYFPRTFLPFLVIILHHWICILCRYGSFNPLDGEQNGFFPHPSPGRLTGYWILQVAKLTNISLLCGLFKLICMCSLIPKDIRIILLFDIHRILNNWYHYEEPIFVS